MPIVELVADYLDQQCANCNTHRRFTRLSVRGAATNDVLEPTEDPYVVALPPCATCGAREFLIRSRGAAPEEQSHQHLVDRLFAAGEVTGTRSSTRNQPALSPASTQGGT